MSFKDIETALQGVQDTVQTGQAQLMSSLEFLETAREILQGTAGHSAVAEHAQAVSLFQEAEADILALHNRLAQFHPAVASYLGSLGLSAPEPDPDVPPEQDKPAPDQMSPATEESIVDPSQSKDAPEDPLEKYREMEEEPAFVGEDSSSYVFDPGDGNLIKLAKGEDRLDWDDDGDGIPDELFPTEQETREDTVKALERGQGVAGAEQLVAHGTFKEEDGSPVGGDSVIIVTKKPAGKQMGHMSEQELEYVTDEDCDKFIGTLKEMEDRGIVIENDPAALYYDAFAGFTVTNYSTVEYRTAGVPNAATSAEDIAVAFGSPDQYILVRGAGDGTVPPQAVKYHEAIKRNLGEEAASRYREKFKNMQWPKT